MSKTSGILAVDEAFQAGKVIDGFVLGEEVHRGGMAVLITATKEGIDLPILLKIPRVGRNQPVESLIGFETELNIMSVLDSPDVPKFLGGGTMATHPYIAMERVAGTPLEKAVEQTLETSAEFDLHQCLTLLINHSAITHLHPEQKVSP